MHVCIIDSPVIEYHPLSLHDALPIWMPDAGVVKSGERVHGAGQGQICGLRWDRAATNWPTSAAACAALTVKRNRACPRDRKSTRLNSSHLGTSYAVFCLKKKKRPPPT